MGKFLGGWCVGCCLVPIMTYFPMNPSRLCPPTGLVLAKGILTTPLFAVVSIDSALVDSGKRRHRDDPLDRPHGA